MTQTSSRVLELTPESPQNTEYLTDIPSATTGIQASATTLTAATDGASVGDVNIILTPALVNKLTALAESVCGSSKHRKRDQESCAYNFINEAAEYPEFGGLNVPINLEAVANLVELAAEAGGAAAGSKTAQAAGLIAIIYWQWEKFKNIPNLIRIPAANVGPSATLSTNAVTSASSNAPCPTGTNIAACDDTTNCSGQNKKCTSGEYNGCPCVNDEVFIVLSLDPAFLASQQAILATLATITAAATIASSTSVGRCGPTSTSGVPGCWGQPGCAYYLAGNGQGCPGVDYCACDGTNVPLLTSTVSGKITSGCG